MSAQQIEFDINDLDDVTLMCLDERRDGLPPEAVAALRVMLSERGIKAATAAQQLKDDQHGSSAYAEGELQEKSDRWLLDQRSRASKYNSATHAAIESEMRRRGMPVPPIPFAAADVRPLRGWKFAVLFIVLAMIINFVGELSARAVSKEWGPIGSIATALILIVVYLVHRFRQSAFYRTPAGQRSRAMDVGTKRGVTELMIAAADGDLVRTIDLLNYGASIDETTKSGLTALMYASASGQFNACSLLLWHGADSSRRSAAGKTAGDIARARGHAEIADLLNRA